MLSKGEVLLLAVIRDLRDHPHYYSVAAAAAAAAVASVSGCALARDVEEERFRGALEMSEGVGGEGSLVRVSIFPEREEYVFEGRCQVMVLAEDKVKARQAILYLQVKHMFMCTCMCSCLRACVHVGLIRGKVLCCSWVLMVRGRELPRVFPILPVRNIFNMYVVEHSRPTAREAGVVSYPPPPPSFPRRNQENAEFPGLLEIHYIHAPPLHIHAYFTSLHSIPFHPTLPHPCNPL